MSRTRESAAEVTAVSAERRRNPGPLACHFYGGRRVLFIYRRSELAWAVFSVEDAGTPPNLPVGRAVILRLSQGTGNVGTIIRTASAGIDL
jgi:hypothetical protein